MTSPRLALTLATALAALAALAVPAAASAAPPPNDNYLASTTIPTGGRSTEFMDSADTSEATTQADTFNPNRDGLPFAGGDPEPTSCPGGTPSYGKTVWWDLRAPYAGGMEIKASGPFDVVVAVYEWSSTTSRITKTVRCSRAGSGVLVPTVRKKTNYTVQVGGAGNTGGPLSFELDYFADRDDDGVLDELDDCPTRAGTRGGCPPELRSAPRIRYENVAGGIRITGLAVDDVPAKARAEVRCGHCGGKVTRRAKRAGVLNMRGFVGRVLRAGDRIELRVTQSRTRRGQFRFGAVGKYFRWPVTSSGLGDRVLRCLQPGSRKPTKCT